MSFSFCLLRDSFDRMAIRPSKGSAEAAGYDLYSFEDKVIQQQSIDLVATGIKLAMQPGFYGKICDRSSMARGGITISGGIIDSDYRGEIRVILNNNCNSPFHVSFGDRIGQIIFQKVEYPDFEEKTVEEFSLLSSARGSGGFGSTGK